MNLKLKTVLASISLIFAGNSSAQLLYKIEGNGLKSPSYIFGTHHIAPLSTIEKFGADKPFAESEQVIGEIDMTQDQLAIQLAMQPHMQAPADSTLSKVISPEDFDIIKKEFKKWCPVPGLELPMLEGMKPMTVTTMVALGMAVECMPDYNPAEQLDTYFQTHGKAQGKKIAPLETVEHQATVLFDTTPIAFQAEGLVEMLKDPEKAMNATKELTEAYNNQDLDKMLQLSREGEQRPEFMQALLDRRNADWLTKLPDMISQAPSFIAVGALHLAGEQGIVEGLRKLGYTVTPIK